MRITIALLSVLAAVQLSFAAIIHVPGEQPTINDGVAVANSGDTVLVEPGIYFEGVVIAGKELTLLAEPGGAQITYFVAYPDTDLAYQTIEGFTLAPFLEGGRDVPAFSPDIDPALLLCTGNAIVTVRNCTIRDQFVDEGHGAYITGYVVAFEDCLFQQNSCFYQGAAVYAAGGLLFFDGCSFVSNGARLEGSAVYAQDVSAVMVNDCDFLLNDYSEVGGQDLHVVNCDSLVVNRCVFLTGTYQPSHSIYVENTPDTRINYSTFFSNSTATAIGLRYDGPWHGLGLHRTLITGYEYAIYCDSFPENNYLSSVCCDFYDNTEIINDGYEISGDYIVADPLFCDTTIFGFWIADLSPCAPDHSPCGFLIGRDSVLCQATYICGDVNGDDLVNVSDAVFMVAYVFVPQAPMPSPLASGDVNCDGIVNVSDIVQLIAYIFGSVPLPCDPDGDYIPDC